MSCVVVGNALAEPEDDLLDYTEEDEAATDAGRGLPGAGGEARAAVSVLQSGTGAAAAEVKAQYGSVHSSGFRDFLLKPELLRAIADCGFEHPSEGTSTPIHLDETFIDARFQSYFVFSLHSDTSSQCRLKELLLPLKMRKHFQNYKTSAKG